MLVSQTDLQVALNEFIKLISISALRNLATLGALIMVLSVVTGTFTQQALQTIPCQKVNPNGKASIPIAQGGTTLRGLQVPSSQSVPEYELTTDLRASLMSGISASNPTNSRPFHQPVPREIVRSKPQTGSPTHHLHSASSA